MTKPYKRLIDRFKCPKCNNHTTLTKEVSLANISEKFLGGHSDKYVLITCSLCGYTEIYNLKVLVHVNATEDESLGARVPEPRQG